VAHLHKFAHALDNLKQGYSWVEKDEIQAITGSKHYIKALFAPGTVLLQPAKYMRQAMQTLPQNVTVYESTPVTEVIYSRSSNGHNERHMCRTLTGAIRPKKVFLCNTGYLTKFGFHDKTAIPLYTYASMTRPLTEAESVKLNARQTFGVIPADSFGTTLRRTADNRLFLRNVYSYARGFKSTQKDLDKARKMHQLAFDRRYPELSSMGYETSWGGMMTLAHNGGMVFGKLAQNIFGTAFCNGTGVSRGTTFGKALAEYALGKESRSIEILLSRAAPNKGLPQFITEMGVRATTSLRLYQAGREV
jgi:glycine/D-amino acid oxidase-like deaminating enzyme